jgi:hypothetical protein
MIGPEHGMRGETTLCGLRRDDVMLMRHYWNIGSADSCDACKAALSSPKPGGALNAEPGTDVYVFPEPWWDLRGHGDRNGRMRQAIGAELARELVAGHPLHEEEVAAIARCKHCDDALFHLHDGRFARVHLSWHGPDRPPWPTSELLQSWAEVVAYAKSHSEEAGFT